MVILGINGGFRAGYQDVSASLIVDGMVIAAVEEERLNRIKFSAGRLPYLAVFEVLKIAKITYDTIDVIAFHGSTWNDEIQSRLENYFITHFGSCPKLIRYHHHHCHAASTFYASGFEKSLILTIDNSGDGVSLRVSLGQGNKIKTIQEFNRPNSLGIFYSLITQYCGFTRDADEYKLMGLASYGDKSFMDFSWLIDYANNTLQINEEYLIKIEAGQASPHKNEMLFNSRFVERMGQPRRLPKTDLSTFYKNVAASAQLHLAKLVTQIAEDYAKHLEVNQLCLAGGVALNCVMNQQLMNAHFIDDLFIQPASSDAGISLGAAWLACTDQGIHPEKTNDTYLGPSFTNKEIKHVLDLAKINHTYVDKPAEEAADFIHDNRVVAWFQGRMEFGPRALGSRSILANPTNPEISKIINAKVKFREGFRPFCPSVLEEDASIYFEGKRKKSPYMTITYDVKDFGIKHIPGVVHIDHTARIQTVNQSQNPLFYELLKKLKSLNGHGVVLNTSFNLSHEPIVCTPRDALASFYSSGIDVLILGNYLIKK